MGLQTGPQLTVSIRVASSLVTALKRHPDFFTGLAVGGYAIWTPEEMAVFGEAYLPPFVPSAYGEHLTWLWNRILEQSWFFPWFDVRGAKRGCRWRMTIRHACTL